MPITYLPITKPGRPQLGSQAIGLANAVLDLRQRTSAILGIASAQWDGASDYSVIQAQFGFANQTDAQSFLTLVTQLDEIFNLETDVTGANRKSRLDQFCNRLAGQ